MSPSSSNSTPALSTQSRSALESLGIPEPHVAQTKRRSRRPFTAAEDDALLKGYAVHGFQWTLIQQDPRLNFSHRKATDLRDRFRTKFPHAYRDGGSVSGKALTNQNQSQSQTDSVGASTSRSHVANNSDQPPSKSHTTPTRASPRRSRSHVATPSQSNSSQIDQASLPPLPQGFLEHPVSLPATGGLSFPLDEGPNADSSATEAPWEDNTLAPMIWDELA